MRIRNTASHCRALALQNEAKKVLSKRQAHHFLQNIPIFVWALQVISGNKSTGSSTNCHLILLTPFPHVGRIIFCSAIFLFSPLPRKMITLEIMRMRTKQKVVPQTVILYCSRHFPMRAGSYSVAQSFSFPPFRGK